MRFFLCILTMAILVSCAANSEQGNNEYDPKKVVVPLEEYYGKNFYYKPTVYEADSRADTHIMEVEVGYLDRSSGETTERAIKFDKMLNFKTLPYKGVNTRFYETAVIPENYVIIDLFLGSDSSTSLEDFIASFEDIKDCQSVYSDLMKTVYFDTVFFYQRSEESYEYVRSAGASEITIYDNEQLSLNNLHSVTQIRDKNFLLRFSKGNEHKYINPCNVSLDKEAWNEAVKNEVIKIELSDVIDNLIQ